LDRILETVGLASAGGLLRRPRKRAHDFEVGQPCANCATPLQGQYCFACGQLAEDYHRSVLKLIVESVEHFFHFDGRFWQTLPKLLIRPGRLTREYLDGHRAPQIPPFRLFLVVLLVTFFVGHFATSQKKEDAPGAATARPTLSQAAAEARREIEADPDLTPEEKREALKQTERVTRAFGVTPRGQAAIEARAAGGDDAHGSPAAAGSRELGDPDFQLFGQGTKWEADMEHWLEERVKAIRDDPERFFLILEIWAHRVAVLTLPVSALLLSILFVFQRRFYFFDHLVFSMHSLSFQLLLLTTILVLSLLVGPVAWWLILLMPIHLYKHMRGAYGSGRVWTVVRMGLLFWGTVITFSLLAVLWLYLGLNDMGGH
jgi:hypothetical protein